MGSDKPTDKPGETQTMFLDLGHETIPVDASGAPGPMLQLPRSTEDHFTRKDLLGQGGMGAVYRAKDQVLQRDIAVKTLFGEVSPRSGYWKRFLREAQITAQLAHPAIVPIHALEQGEDGQPRLIMKLVRGKTLDDYMDTCRSAGKAEAGARGLDLLSRIGKLLRVCEAMAYAHSHGVIHRDLKPQNIMVGEFDEVYVMDWGMARALGEEDEEVEGIALSGQGVQTVAGALMGTPRYMAPEQARMEYDEVGPAADQYALGVVLYELATLLAGRSADSIEELVSVAAEAMPMDFTGSQVDPRLQAIILKATAPFRSGRYASVEELARDLRRFRRGDAVSALPESLLRRGWRAFSRRPLLAMGTVLALVLVAAASSIWSLRTALDSQKTAARKLEVTSELIGAVSSNALLIDELLGKTHMLLNGLTSSVQLKLQLELPTADPPRCIPPPALEGLPEARPHERYNDNFVSLRRAVCRTAPGLSRAATPAGHALGENIQDELAAVLLQGRTTEELDGTFWEKERPETIQWVYAGTKDGVLVNYPGIHFFPESYDPRLRPWFVNGIGHELPKCRDPYPDASGSGYLLPCTQRLLNAQGEVFGVAGIDFSMDAVIDAIQQVRLPHLKESLLVGSEGQVIASSTEKGERLSPEEAMVGNAEKKMDRLESAKLRAELGRGLPNGLVLTEEGTYAYSRLQFADWTLVFALDSGVWTDG